MKMECPSWWRYFSYIIRYDHLCESRIEKVCASGNTQRKNKEERDHECLKNSKKKHKISTYNGMKNG